MNSSVVKRSISVGAHKTSVSLEQPFWDGLREIAVAQGATANTIVTVIDAARRDHNLSSAIRIFVLEHYRAGASRQAARGHLYRA